MSNSSRRGRKNRQGQSHVAWGPVLFPPSGETCDKCKPLDDNEVTLHYPLAILPNDSVLDRGISYRELRLLQTVRKATEAAQNVLDEHGDRCESHGCEVCRATRGLLWVMEQAHGSLESQLPSVS